MKKFIIKLLVVAMLAANLLGCLSACNTVTEEAPSNIDMEAPNVTETPTNESTENNESKPAETEKEADEFKPVDLAGSIALDMTSNTLKQEVSVKTFIDGDTTHFHVPTSLMDTGVIKVRYLAINTPESTGKIEEWGKAASTFTKEKLSSATSIVIESDDAKLNADSTGDRYLFWVWYKPEGSDSYRNLNIEILQNGLAIASNSANNRYGTTCMAAINQAKAQKLCVHSGQQDPDFYYGEAQVITLKELRCNVEDYVGTKVAFTGVITMNCDNAVYVESYDEETDVWYGMYVYYGFGLNGTGLEILAVGNESRIVGTVQYYEAGGTYQVSDLNYRMMKPDDPNNIQLISEGNEPAYVVTDPDTFVNGEVTVALEEETITESYAALAMNTSVEIQNLYVMDAYTTKTEDSASKGAFTLYCRVDGIPVTVRTVVLHDENGNLIKQDAYLGRTINVRGIVDYFSGDYQIKVFSPKDITIVK